MPPPAAPDSGLTGPKLSKAAVFYRAGKADGRCGSCRYFVPPAACLCVEGQISAQGRCDRLRIERDWEHGPALIGF